MSYITGFMDGESYGASDINKVISRFVTAGIEDAFIDGKPYNVRKLNEISKAITSRGVIGSESDALRVIRIGSDYYVSPGTAFFGNGSTLEVIENEPLTIEDASAVNFVYLVSNEEENRNYIAVSTEEPDIADDNTVMLCEIGTDGTITDRRCYATGKLRGMYEDNAVTMKCIRVQDSLAFGDGWDVYIDKDLECPSFSFMLFICWERVDENGNYSKNGKSTGNYRSCSALWIPSQQRYIGIGCTGYSGNSGNCYCFDSHGSMDSMYGQQNFVITGGAGHEVSLNISHVSGNIWRFHYTRGDIRYYQNMTTDFKLFYI